MSLRLEYVSVVGDDERVLDVLEVDGAARVTSATTGRGRATVEMLSRRYPVAAGALKIMKSWSNGYVLLREAAPVAAGSDGAT